MPEGAAIVWAGFLAVTSLVLLVFMLVSGRKGRLDTRLQGLTGKGGASGNPDTVGDFARSALPRMGAPLVPKDEEERTRLKGRLVHAGLYGRQAMVVFLGVKVLLMVTPPVLGLALGVVGLV